MHSETQESMEELAKAYRDMGADVYRSFKGFAAFGDAFAARARADRDTEIIIFTDARHAKSVMMLTAAILNRTKIDINKFNVMINDCD
jgi:murein tripeptide amidase MpaA